MSHQSEVHARRRRKLVVHSTELENSEEDNYDDVRAELRATSFNLVCGSIYPLCVIIGPYLPGMLGAADIRADESERNFRRGHLR